MVATHCDCSIGRHLDGVVFHNNMNYFNAWMHLRFRIMHIRIRVDGDGTIVYVFKQTSQPQMANVHFKINVSCRCQIAKINYVCVITIKWNICDMNRPPPPIIGNGGGVAHESDVGIKNV